MQSVAQTIYTNYKKSLQLLVGECIQKAVEINDKRLATTEYIFSDGSYILISAGHVTPYESK